VSWKAYKYVYRAKSPVCIGWHTLGYVKLTRYYIPGKNLWASFTCNLARANPLGLPYENNQKNIYHEYGEIVKKNILTSYFYPALPDKKPLIPEYTDGDLKFDKYSRAEFERLFIKSYGTTAILPESNTAEEESLHEVEFISPETEKGKVYFVGYVIVNNEDGLSSKSLKWDNIKDYFKEIFVGGERRYGWGRLVLEEGPSNSNTEFFGYKLVLNSGPPTITLPEKNPIPAHLLLNKGEDLNPHLRGDIEPLVGREWGEIKTSGEPKKWGFGQTITEKAKICWTPGSVIQEVKRFKISDYGLLEGL
jgi:hypothetical protein